MGAAGGLKWTLIHVLLSAVGSAPSRAQLMAGVYDFGQGRSGERRGDWTPSEWLALVLLLMTIAFGLAVSVGLCYYVKKRETRRTFGSSLVVRI